MDYLDTALVYADGWSHKTIAPFIKQIGDRKKLWITSKGPSKDATVESYTRDLDTCLEQLETDYLDLYFMHVIDDPEFLEPEYIKMGEAMRKSGKTRFFGFSCHGGEVAALMDKAAEVGGIDAIMFRYSFARYGDLELNKAIDKCKKAGIGLIAMKTQESVPDDQAEVVDVPVEELQPGPGQVEGGLGRRAYRLRRLAHGQHDQAGRERRGGQVAGPALDDRVPAAAADRRRPRAAYSCHGCSQICESRVDGDVKVADTLRYLMYHECYGEPDQARSSSTARSARPSAPWTASISPEPRPPARRASGSPSASPRPDGPSTATPSLFLPGKRPPAPLPGNRRAPSLPPSSLRRIVFPLFLQDRLGMRVRSARMTGPSAWAVTGRRGLAVAALALVCLSPVASGAVEEEAGAGEGPPAPPSTPAPGVRPTDISQHARPDSVPDDATLEAAGAVIGEIHIEVRDVFDPNDPKENNKLFRFANKLHINTRQSVVRRELLFRPGDPYSGRKVAESERLLRASSFFYDARVYPVRYEDGRVDLHVIVRDVWTLIAGVGFGRGGGENSFKVALEDNNFLGYGKDIGIQWTKDVDRSSVLYRYGDPNLAGTRLSLQLWYQDNSDGFLKRIEFGRPFYSLDTRHMAGGGAFTWERTDFLYDLGEIKDEFRHDQDHLELRAGFSAGLVGQNVNRWTYGLTYERDRFAAIDGVTLPGSVPEDRLLIYPWIGFNLVQDRYAKMHNVDKIHRTEDLNFGTEFSTRVGWSDEAFGANRSQAIVGALFKTTMTPATRQILIAEIHASGRFGSEGSENLLSGGSARWFVPNLTVHQFYVALFVDAAHNLDGEKQLLLGGDNGLRGYPLRYQDGDRRFLFTVEQRFYTPWHVLRLFRIGAAIFFDAGAAWFAGGGGGPEPS